jgi:hypothetical protein
MSSLIRTLFDGSVDIVGGENIHARFGVAGPAAHSVNRLVHCGRSPAPNSAVIAGEAIPSDPVSTGGNVSLIKKCFPKRQQEQPQLIG